MSFSSDENQSLLPNVVSKKPHKARKAIRKMKKQLIDLEKAHGKVGTKLEKKEKGYKYQVPPEFTAMFSVNPLGNRPALPQIDTSQDRFIYYPPKQLTQKETNMFATQSVSSGASSSDEVTGIMDSIHGKSLDEIDGVRNLSIYNANSSTLDQMEEVGANIERLQRENVKLDKELVSKLESRVENLLHREELMSSKMEHLELRGQHLEEYSDVLGNENKELSQMLHTELGKQPDIMAKMLQNQLEITQQAKDDNKKAIEKSFELSEKITRHQKEIDAYEEKLQLAEAQLESVTRNFGITESAILVENDNLEQALAFERDQNEQNEVELLSLNDRLKEEHRKTLELTAEVDALEAVMESIKEDTIKIQGMVSVLGAAYNQQASQLGLVRRNAEYQLDEKDDAIAKLEFDYDEAKQNYSLLQESLSEMACEKDNLERKEVELQNEVDSLYESGENQLAKMRMMLGDATEDAREARRESHGAKRIAEITQKKLVKAVELGEHFDQQFKDEQKVTYAQHNKIELLESLMESKQEAYAKLLKDNEVLETDMRALQTENSKLRVAVGHDSVLGARAANPEQLTRQMKATQGAIQQYMTHFAELANLKREMMRQKAIIEEEADLEQTDSVDTAVLEGCSTMTVFMDDIKPNTEIQQNANNLVTAMHTFVESVAKAGIDADVQLLVAGRE